MFCVSSAPGQHFCKDSLLPGVKQNFFAEHWQFETNQTRNSVSQVQCRDFYSHLTSYTESPCSLTECLEEEVRIEEQGWAVNSSLQPQNLNSRQIFVL